MSSDTDKAIDRALTGLDKPHETVPEPEHELDPHTRHVLADLARDSGAIPEARPYLIRRMRYTLGKAALPSCPPKLRVHENWLKRRAWDLLDANRDQLPALLDEREPHQ